MNGEQLRAVFEAWYVVRYCRRLSDMSVSRALRTKSNGEYESCHLKEFWECWKVAIDSQAKEMERILLENKELHIDLAKLKADESLASQAKSVPDGYMINVLDNSWVVVDKEHADEAEKHGFTVKPYYFAPQAPTDDDRVRELESKYNELIMAVACKFPDETRHETALRYIKNAEAPAVAVLGQSMKGGTE